MSLAAKLRNAQHRPPGRAAEAVERLRATLTRAERREFDKALREPWRVGTTELVRLLDEDGHPIAKATLDRWRQNNPSELTPNPEVYE